MRRLLLFKSEQNTFLFRFILLSAYYSLWYITFYRNILLRITVNQIVGRALLAAWH